MRKKFYVFWIIILFFLSCNQKHKSSILFEEIIKVECSSIDYPDMLGITMQIIGYENYLFLNDFYGDSLIHVFNLNNKSIRKVIPKGNGPNELISPLEIYVVNDKLYLFGRQLFSLYSIALDSIDQNKMSLTNKFQVPTMTSRIGILNDSLFIASGLFKKRYALIDNTGDVITEFGDYPDFWKEEQNIPVEAKAMFHQCGFAQNLERNKFISYSAHVLDIFDVPESSVPIISKRILFADYEYSYTTGEYLSAKSLGNGKGTILDACCTDQYIYVVCQAFETNSENVLSQIKIFNWVGEPIKQIDINEKIACLFIDEDNLKGYIIAKKPEDNLMFFSLNGII